MGIYDSYRQTNSTAIPQFAGSVMPELTQAKRELDFSYDTASDSINKTTQMKDNTPVFKADEKEFLKVKGSIDGELRAISSHKNLEDMVPATDALARKSAQALKPFAENQASYQAYLGELKDHPLSEALVAKSIDDYKRYKTGKPDPITGSPVGKFSGIRPVKPVDLPKKMDEWVKGAVARTTGGEVINTGNGYIVKKGSTTTVLNPDEIRRIAEAAYAIDPEVQAYVRQQGELSGWEIGTNAKAAYAGLAAGPTKDKIDVLMSRGVPLREAVENVSSNDMAEGLKNKMMDYGADKYKQNDSKNTIDMTSDAGYWALRKEKQDADQQGRMAIITPTTGIDPSTDDSFEELDGRLATNTKSLEGSKAELSKYYKFDASGNLQTSPTGLVSTGVPIPGEITGQISGMVDSYFTTQQQMKVDNGLKAHALNQSAIKAGFDGTNGNGYGLQGAKDFAQGQWTRAFTSDPRATYRATTGTPSTGVKELTVTKALIVKGLKEGRGEPVYNSFGALQSVKITQDGKQYTVPFGSGNSFDNEKNGLGDRLEAGVTVLGNINKGAKSGYKEYRKNYSVNGAGVSFKDIGKENSDAKYLNDAVVNELATNIGAYKVYKAGKKVAGSEEDVTEYDFSKATIGSYEPLGNGQMKVNASVMSGGKHVAVEIVVPSSSSMGQEVRRLAGGSNDPRIRRLGEAFNSGDSYGNLMFTPTQGVAKEFGNDIELTPKSGSTPAVTGKPVKVTSEASSGTTKMYIEYWNPYAGKYEKYTKSNGAEYSTTDGLEAASIAEGLLPMYK